jgi:hypothetical protein
MSLSRIALPAGLQLSSSSLINDQSSWRQIIEVPMIEIVHLIRQVERVKKQARQQHHYNTTTSSSSSSSSFTSSYASSSSHHHKHNIHSQSHQHRDHHSSHSHPSSSSPSDLLDSWVAVARFSTGLQYTTSQQRSNWREAMKEQQDFIYGQSYQEVNFESSEAEELPWHLLNALRVPYAVTDDVPLLTNTEILRSSLLFNPGLFVVVFVCAGLC